MQANRWAVLLGGVVAVLAVACGGGGDTQVGTPAAAVSDGGGSAGGAVAPGTSEGAVPDAATSDGEVPAFMADFSRVCTAQVGFPGVAAFDGEPGVHKVQLFEELREDDNFIESARSLPEAWVVTQDADFADNTELADVELVACADRTAEKPNGTKCDFEADDGAVTTVELVDTTYKLTVYEAATGETIGGDTVKAATTECPMFASLEEGQTELLNRPGDDRIIKALRPFVAP